MSEKKALVLLSGGQDSATCLAIARTQYKEIFTISFDYGQRHKRELLASKVLSAMFNAVEHFQIDATAINQVAVSNLTNRNGDINKSHEINPELPSSFVPGRNLIFLTLAAAKAYSLKIDTLYTGVCQTDYSGYPDCRDEFIISAMKTITFALDSPIMIETPLMFYSKAETVRIMDDLGKLELYKYTHTCYEGQWPPCNICPACKIRAKGFNESNFLDPLGLSSVDPLSEFFGSTPGDKRR